MLLQTVSYLWQHLLTKLFIIVLVDDDDGLICPDVLLLEKIQSRHNEQQVKTYDLLLFYPGGDAATVAAPRKSQSRVNLAHTHTRRVYSSLFFFSLKEGGLLSFPPSAVFLTTLECFFGMVISSCVLFHSSEWNDVLLFFSSASSLLVMLLFFPNIFLIFCLYF